MLFSSWIFRGKVISFVFFWFYYLPVFTFLCIACIKFQLELVYYSLFVSDADTIWDLLQKVLVMIVIATGLASIIHLLIEHVFDLAATFPSALPDFRRKLIHLGDIILSNRDVRLNTESQKKWEFRRDFFVLFGITLPWFLFNLLMYWRVECLSCYDNDHTSDCFFWCQIYFNFTLALIMVLVQSLVLLFSILSRPYPDVKSRSIWETVLVNTENWESVVSDLKYSSMLLNLLLLVISSLLAGTTIGASTFLVICSGQSLFYAVTWLCVNFLIFLHEVWVQTRNSFLYSFFIGVWISIVAAMAKHQFNSVPVAVASIYGVIAILNILPHFVFPLFRTFFQQIADLYGYACSIRPQGVRNLSISVPRSHFKRRATYAFPVAIFALMAFTVMSVLQGILVHNGIPDTFFVTGHPNISRITPNALSVQIRVHQNLLASADIRILSRESKQREGDYVFCDQRLFNLSYIDYGLLAQMAYFPPGPDFDSFKQVFFPDWELAYSSKIRTRGVFFYDLRRSNLSVISIRGTNLFNLLDWVQDMDIFLEAFVFQLFSNLLPGLSIWPTALIGDQIKLISYLDSLLPEGERHYYDPVVTYVEKIKKTRNVVVVGHSLGGSLAQIVGALTERHALSFSGPGIVESRKKLKISLQSIDKFIINFAPTYDWVAKIGKMGGQVNNLICSEKRTNMCHMLMYTVCELVSKCGHPSLEMECLFRSGSRFF